MLQKPFMSRVALDTKCPTELRRPLIPTMQADIHTVMPGYTDIIHRCHVMLSRRPNAAAVF